MGWWGKFMDISELPIAFLYVIYISLYFYVAKNYEDLGSFKRYIAPFLAGCGSIYIIFGAIQKDMFLQFLIITLINAAISLPFLRKRTQS